MGLEWAALRRSDIYRGSGVPPGRGRGVLLIPGFLAGDGSLATMTQWLRAAGYRTKRAGISWNVAWLVALSYAMSLWKYLVPSSATMKTDASESSPLRV